MTRIFHKLLGKTMKHVTRTHDEMLFETIEGEKYRFFHSQDCCESVTIEDICGDLNDLVGSPLTTVEETGRDAKKTDLGDSQSWTFYRFATAKGWVTVRWYGTSNGYYSESVDFEEIV